MNICIPKERRDSEYRVGLTPAGIQLLTQTGHACFVEHEAGLGSGFRDQHFQDAGAQIVYSGEEIYGRADLLLKIARPTMEEFEWMREGQILLGFLHLAAGMSEKVTTLVEKKITAIGYEIIQDKSDLLPVLKPISQVAGRMIPHVAANLSQNNNNGKGILLGGVPGVPPADVVILGGGVVGTEAARTFLGMGAKVYLLDKDLSRLQEIALEFNGRIITMVSHWFNIEKVCKFADILVGAILVPGARTPIVVNRAMIASMRRRSLVMDISIDQGGCFETSRPTTHSDPTFIEEGVLHYCVPNMTGVLGRTATHALHNASWPYISLIAKEGLEGALKASPTLARGVYTHNGDIRYPTLRDIYASRR